MDTTRRDFLGKIAVNAAMLGAMFLARGIERLSLVGGLSEAITPWLTPDLRARLKRPDADAAAGALLVARERLAVPGKDSDYEQTAKFRV